jgi:hypothetical protein
LLFLIPLPSRYYSSADFYRDLRHLLMERS